MKELDMEEQKKQFGFFIDKHYLLGDAAEGCEHTIIIRGQRHAQYLVRGNFYLPGKCLHCLAKEYKII